VNLTKPENVQLKPFKNADGTHRVEGMWVGQASMTDTQYHATRDGIFTLRKDPEAAKLFDRYLDGVSKDKLNFTAAEMDKLDTSLAKAGLARGSVVNDVGANLKAHRYDPHYRPTLMVDVNGRSMSPSAVRQALESYGVEVSGDPPKSLGPGKVSQSSLGIDKGGLTKAMTDEIESISRRVNFQHIEKVFGYNGASILAQVGEAAGGIFRRLPVVGKLASVASLTVAFGGVANASTPEQAAAARQNLKAEVIGMIDPTMGIVSEGLPSAVADIRENGDRRRAETRVAARNGRIQRELDFILSDEHPSQLGSLKVQDASGKPIPIAEALRNPNMHSQIFAEIDGKAKMATNPEIQQQLADMRQAASDYISMQSRLLVAQIPVQAEKIVPRGVGAALTS
jgi:hypothetical protein